MMMLRILVLKGLHTSLYAIPGILIPYYVINLINLIFGLLFFQSFRLNKCFSIGILCSSCQMRHKLKLPLLKLIRIWHSLITCIEENHYIQNHMHLCT